MVFRDGNITSLVALAGDADMTVLDVALRLDTSNLVEA
jgi:hypothetical protein